MTKEFIRFKEWILSEVDEKDYYNIYLKNFSTTIKGKFIMYSIEIHLVRTTSFGEEALGTNKVQLAVLQTLGRDSPPVCGLGSDRHIRINIQQQEFQ